MSHQYTPGPWSCDHVSEYTGEMLVRAENGDTVARVCCYGQQSETPFAQEHNANLIAAAPDLLAELRHAMRFFYQLGPADAERMSAVIAKATGSAA